MFKTFVISIWWNDLIVSMKLLKIVYISYHLITMPPITLTINTCKSSWIIKNDTICYKTTAGYWFFLMAQRTVICKEL